MRVTIWGCRGSLATPGPATLKYGGNTACIQVALDDRTDLVLDAGTGIRPLGRELQSRHPEVLHLFLTHLHLDHLQGMGFFPLLGDPEVEVHVWGPASPVQSLEKRIARYLSPPLFPVRLHDLMSAVTFHDVPEGEWEIGGARLVAEAIAHQGPTLGYRVEENGRALAYLPDHEPARGRSLREIEPEWISGLSLVHGVDVLLHDCQYTDEEYSEKLGWGHSALSDTVAFAKLAGVGRLVLFHHDPGHDDDQLERMLRGAHELWGEGENRPLLAYEGMVLEL
ncbi:MAG: MBL fold metallo-hydrolase [Actinomycetota bacterium]|nr:MBL fold metallo-hydrolase [Actinomycetota bacterium]